jgi:hypothetical protein
MKKKKLSLTKKLLLQRETVAPLNTEQQNQLAGGAKTTWGCPTWLPNAGCLTETNPHIICF